MTDEDDQLLDEAGNRALPVVVQDVDQAVARVLVASNKIKWRTGVDLTLKTKAWRPHAVSASGHAVLYVCLTPLIPRYAASRMEEAASIGKRLYVALNFETLYTPESMRALAVSDAEVMVLNHPEMKDLRPRHFMAAMAKLCVPVEPSARVTVCREVHSRLGDGNEYWRGRRFEALLAFLLSQVNDFRVVEQNFRTATQELDIVLQIDRHSQRPWNQYVPYLLVEAKNWAKPADQQVVSTFMTKIQSKGQSCKMGFLICTSGFTKEAEDHELRYSLTENRIALIGPTELKSLINAEELDDTLDDIVRQARLR